MKAPQSRRLLDEGLLPLFRGYGQILFQPSAATGGLFALAALLSAPTAFAVSLGAAMGAWCSGWWWLRNQVFFNDGTAIFNAALAGLALGSFLKFSPMLLLIAAGVGALTVCLLVVLRSVLPLPVYTVPYIVMTWIALPFCTGIFGSLDAPALTAEAGALTAPGANSAQVLFSTEQWVGVAVALAVFVHSRAAGLWVLIAAIGSWLIALGLGLPDSMTKGGLLGYNALILASALHARGTAPGGILFGIALSVVLSYALLELQVTLLSLPFVLSAWLVIVFGPKPTPAA